MISKFHTENSKGIGLLGLILIIMVLALAAAMILLLMKSTASNREVQKTMGRASTISFAINQYRDNNADANPATLNDLVTTTGVACALDNTPASPTYLTLQGWCGPYLEVAFQEFSTEYKTDGWGVLYVWAPASGTGTLTSCGPDRTCSNADDITFTP